MAIILVDSNVVLDLADKNSSWSDWSIQILEELELENHFVINSIIYSEISIGFEMIEDCETFLFNCGFEVLQIPREALFLAGKVFLAYRKKKGTKINVLPDFFIGAHAVINNYKLIARDKHRYNTYYPTIELITEL